MKEHSRDSKRRFLGAALAALILAVVFFFASPAAPYFRGLYANLSAPSPDNIDPSFASLSREALIGRVIADETLLSRIRYQAVLYGLLADENAKLRTLLHGTTTPDALLARVVSRPPETLYDTVIIDRGSGSGIAAGDLVVYQGIALGRVLSEENDSALVELFSSAGSKEDVIIGKPAAISIASGEGGGSFELSIPQGIMVSAGDPVRVEASASLLLGTVVSVAVDQSQASQRVFVHSPFSLADIDFVQILKSPH